ncbi:unnamed protein product [Mycena citricolor]|uniref:Uncharacterized protein n=1 Tax=Mycena citricolor TaxID=2018698 RepID=A0AAD2GVM0_9AGAR|nr:unnamed protein product [Mycena citricolor]
MSVFTRLSFVSETKPPRSFNLLTQPREFGAPRSAYPRTHRRHNSEPFASFSPASKTRLLGDLPLLLERTIPIVEEDEDCARYRTPQRFNPGLLASPISLDVPAATSHQQQKQQQYRIRRPRPDRDSSSSAPPPPCSPEIVLGEPKEHIGHPKTRLTQPVLKLAAIKERLAHLESMNERLQQRAASAATDTALLSASMTYFSSEYYAGLLAMRELRAVICGLEREVGCLKRFVGLMVEVGRHEPVLERAYSGVREGREFEPVLVDAVRSAAARRGSGWAQILTAAAARDSEYGPLDDTRKEHDARPTQVDDLLKSLKNGNIPPGRHRSAAQTKSLACLSSSPTKKSPAPKTGVNSSPTRRPLRALDPNRTKNSSSSDPKAGDQTLSSLQRILQMSDDSSSQAGRDSAPPQIFVYPPTVCAVKKPSFKPLVSPVKSRTRPAAAVSPVRGGKKGEWR